MNAGAGRIRNPAEWLRVRMAAWLDSDGNPLPPPGPGHGSGVIARRYRPAGRRPWAERGLAGPERGLTTAEVAELERTPQASVLLARLAWRIPGLAAADDERARLVDETRASQRPDRQDAAPGPDAARRALARALAAESRGSRS
jgi:hypothetical protein